MLSNFVSVFPSREVQEWTLLDPSLLWKYPLINIFNVQYIQHFNTNIFRQKLQQRYQSKVYIKSILDESFSQSSDGIILIVLYLYFRIIIRQLLVGYMLLWKKIM